MNSFVGQSSKKIGQLFQQSNQLHIKGQLESAREGYLQVIKAQPKHFDALHLLGVLYCQLKDYGCAIDYVSRALQLTSNPVFYYSLGVAYQESGQLDAAERSYLSALKGRPKYPEALYNLGNIKRAKKNNQEALVYFDQALLLKADYADAYYNRGNALKDLGEYASAVQSFESATALNKAFAPAYLNKGLAQKEMGHYELALESYTNALRVNPGYSDAYSNMGILYTELKLWAQAMQSFNEALNLNPNHAQALWNKSLLLLLHGNFKDGFALYGARWREEVMISPVLSSTNPWITSSMFGSPNLAEPENSTGVVHQPICQRLLIWAEQGVGDEVMFAVLLPRACVLASKILVQVDERLIPLFRRSFPDYEFLPKGQVIAESNYDQHMPMGQLAEIFCQNQDAFKTIPAGYLLSDTTRRSQIKEQIPLKQKPTIGISWRSKNDKKGRDRSISALDLVGALCLNSSGGFALDRFNFINLQYGATQEELQIVRETLGIEVLSYADIDNFSDIDGLATLIDACDAVVSIDNSTVHLAGALNRATYVLLPFSADWRWGLSSERSYWYKSLFLYRQSNPGEWASPLFALQADLLKNYG